MSDVAVLGVVVVALYLSECVVWARHGSFVLKLPWFYGVRARLHTSSKSLGTKASSASLLNPLPPFGRVYVVEPWPFSFNDDGVVAFRSFALDKEPRPVASAQRFAWSDIASVGVDDKAVTINGAPFATCSSKRHAKAAAAALTTMRDKPKHHVVDDLIEAHLDPEPVRALVDKHERWGAPLLLASTGCFAALFVLVPRTVRVDGLTHWPFLLASVYAWVVVCVVSMYVAHRKLSKAERGERWMQTLLMLPAPTMAMRGNDKLGRHLLAGAHPIAAACAALDDKQRDDVVGRALRDLTFPRALPPLDEPSLQIEADFRARVLERAKKVAKKAGVDVDACFAPPAALKPGHGACPRCRAIYRVEADAMTTCGDCGIGGIRAMTVDAR